MSPVGAVDSNTGNLETEGGKGGREKGKLWKFWHYTIRPDGNLL